MLDRGQQLVLQQILEPLPLGEAHLWRNPAVAPSRMCARVCFRPSLRSVDSHPQQEPARHRRTSHARPASPFSSASYLAPRPSVRPERESAQRRGRVVCARQMLQRRREPPALCVLCGHPCHACQPFTHTTPVRRVRSSHRRAAVHRRATYVTTWCWRRVSACSQPP